MPPEGVLPPKSLYGRVAYELRLAPSFGLWAVAKALSVGIAHALVALSAGLLAQRIAGQPATLLSGLSLPALCLIGLIAALVKALGGAALAYSEVTLAGRVGNTLRVDVAQALIVHGGRTPAQHLLARIAVRIRDVEAAAAGAVSVARAVAQLIPLLAALCVVSLPLSLGAIVVLAPFSVVVSRLRRRWRAAAEHAQVRAEQLHQHVDELVSNLDLFRTYGAGEHVVGALSRAGERASRVGARVEAQRTALSGANETLAALVILLGVLAYQQTGMDLGSSPLLAFAAVFFMAYRPLRDLGDGRSTLVRGDAALAALGEVLAKPGSNRELRDPWGFGDLGLREFGVAARGPRVDAVLSHGELLVLSGPNGSGKTSLLRALLGLEPSVGQLQYGGTDLQGRDVGPGERPFAWVPQDAPLVTGSTLHNICLMGASEGDAREALDLLGAGWLLARLGEQLLGPGGRDVSGGERRLIALARAVATRQPVLLLDEPFAGMDDSARGQLYSALQHLKGKRSLIVVSHDPAPLTLADRTLSIAAAAQGGAS